MRQGKKSNHRKVVKTSFDSYDSAGGNRSAAQAVEAGNNLMSEVAPNVQNSSSAGLPHQQQPLTESGKTLPVKNFQISQKSSKPA